MTEQVRRDMAGIQSSGWSGADINTPGWRCRVFCNAMIRQHFAYAEEFRTENLSAKQMAALYGDPNNVFLAGLLRTQRGSCVSMPLVYLVIGQRLGYPVHLVAVGKHYFIRWEEPGYRMNIETTITDKVCNTPDDSVYLGTEGITREQLKGSDLRNLTTREVMGELFFTRAAYWATKGEQYREQQCHDLSLARELAPDDANIKETAEAVFKHYGLKSEYTVKN